MAKVNSSRLNFRGGAVVQAWEVQGANFSGPGPYVVVVRVSRQLPADETASNILPRWPNSWTRLVMMPT